MPKKATDALKAVIEKEHRIRVNQKEEKEKSGGGSSSPGGKSSMAITAKIVNGILERLELLLKVSIKTGLDAKQDSPNKAVMTRSLQNGQRG